MKNLNHFILVSFATLMIMSCEKSFAQVSTLGHTGFVGDYVGWDISMIGIPLDIVTTLPENINFSTNSALRMNILGNTGFVGIGSNLGAYTPAFFLDVQNQINVNFSGVNPINAFGIGYYIGGDMVLQIPGTSNLFGGTNSGTAWTTGTNNTFLGDRTGVANNSGSWNTFIGFEAGELKHIRFTNI